MEGFIEELRFIFVPIIYDLKGALQLRPAWQATLAAKLIVAHLAFDFTLLPSGEYRRHEHRLSSR